MPLSQDNFADNDDNLLFQLLKTQKWDQVSSLLSEKVEPLSSTTTPPPPSSPNNNNANKYDAKVLVTQVDCFGNTPLHTAIGYKAPDVILFQLLELYPDATKIHGTDYWLPLHVAAMWGTSRPVMEKIITLYPQALDDCGEPGIKGRTPRHFASRFVHNTDLLNRSTMEWIKQIEQESSSIQKEQVDEK